MPLGQKTASSSAFCRKVDSESVLGRSRSRCPKRTKKSVKRPWEPWEPWVAGDGARDVSSDFKMVY